MYITPGMILLGYLVYVWFSQPPRPMSDAQKARHAAQWERHVAKGRQQIARRQARELASRRQATIPPVDTSGYRQYLWLPLCLVVFVVLSLLTHALVPR
jgi:hypothetical protein